MLTLAGIAIALFLAWKTPEAGLRGLCFGAVVALVYTLGRNAWSLEKKARRAQVAQIGVGDDRLYWRDENGREVVIAWSDVSDIDVQSGRLIVQWPEGQLAFSAREIADGMDLIRAIHAARERALGRFAPPTNFIPLDSM